MLLAAALAIPGMSQADMKSKVQGSCKTMKVEQAAPTFKSRQG